MNSNETNKIDQALDSAGSQTVRRIVRELADEELNMVWRSQLNEKIQLATLARSRRALTGFLWKGGLGLGLAGIMMFTVFLRMPTSSAPTGNSNQSLEAVLLSSHSEAAVAIEVSGPGTLTIDSASTKQADPASSNDWSITDTEAL